MEQELIEDLVIESIRIYGIDTWYIPRIIGARDELLNEDEWSTFEDAYSVEMYVKNVEGFEGEGDFLSKFGLQIRDSMTLTVAMRSFEFEVGTHTEQTRPNEGDLIYMPLNQKFFKVMHVEHESIFYQMGGLQTYDLRCELFEYSNETFNTGHDFIDDYFEQYSTFQLPDGITYTVGHDGSNFIINDEPAPKLYDIFVGQKYIFDVSNTSNANTTLGFYTEATTTLGVPTGVLNREGTPGEEGAYIEWTPEVADNTYYLEVDTDTLGNEIEMLVSQLEDIEEYDPAADNTTIQREAENILDFSEMNPFGEDDF